MHKYSAELHNNLFSYWTYTMVFGQISFLWEQNDPQHTDAEWKRILVKNMYIQTNQIKQTYRQSWKILTLNCLGLVSVAARL